MLKAQKGKFAIFLSTLFLGLFFYSPTALLAENEGDLVLLWSYQTGGDIGYSSPAIGSNGTIYVGSEDSCLHAITDEGTQKWRFVTNGMIWASPAIGSDGTIYVGSHDGNLYAITDEGAQGNLKWSFAISTWNEIESSPAIGSDGTIYVGSGDTLYAITDEGTHGSWKWGFFTGGKIFSSPAIGSDGTIYVGSYDNNLYAINPDGTEKWVFATTGEILSSPAIASDGTIYVGSLDGMLYAITDEGTQKWSFLANGHIISSPAIGSDGTIYGGVMNFQLADIQFYAITDEGDHGNLKWTEYLGVLQSSPAIGSDGTIYAGGAYGRLWAITDEGTQGSLEWFEIEAHVEGSPAIGTDGTIYVGASDGYLYAFDHGTGVGLADSPWPKFHHDARNTGCAEEIKTPADLVEDINDYITDLDPSGFDNPAHQNALINQLEALAAIIEGLNPTAALARLDNISKRVEKWVEDEEDKAAILAMIDRLIAYLETQETPGQGKGKANKGAALASVSLPEKFQLLQNSPNPFNPSTTISYSVPEGASERITLKVYDLRGRLVRILVEGIIGPGTYSVYWDGKDKSGCQVASGVYLYRIKAGEFMQTRKMVILK